MSTLKVNTIQEADGTAFPFIGMLDSYMLNATTTFGNDTETTMDSGVVRASTLLSTTGNIGTGVTKSGSNFSFPSTGIYQIVWRPILAATNGNRARYSAARLYATTDNSSYTDIIGQASSIGDSGGGGTLYYANFNVHTHLDVTDTSNIKVRFVLYSDGNVTWRGYTGYPSTYAIFTKIGET